MRMCLRALVAEGLRRVSSVAICTLGMPTQETGRETALAIRKFLKTNEPSLKEQLNIHKPFTPKVVYNAAEPQEISGANKILKGWWKEILQAFSKGNPYFILEEGINLLQKGEESQEENGPAESRKKKAAYFRPATKSPQARGKSGLNFFLDSESGEEGFEKPSAERLQTLTRINQLSGALLDEHLGK